MALEFALSGIRPIDPSAAGGSSPSSVVAPAQGGTSFAEALKNVAQDAVADIAGAENLSMQALSGKADIREVADAVMTAEQSLQAAISIRDKIVTAYLEISRMQI